MLRRIKEVVDDYSAPFKVVLDACVLYPFTIRDVLLEAAASAFYQVYWSETILDESLRNLIKDGRMTEEQTAKLSATMRRAFPEAQVTDYENLIPSMRNDKKDRHVVAAAVKAGAQVIVTSNKRDFYDLPSGIEVQTPDEFLSNLFDLYGNSANPSPTFARSGTSSDGDQAIWAT